MAFTQGTINVRYCNPLVGGPFPPPPSFEPLNYNPTTGLDLSSMTARTICPNGLTVSANQRLGHDLTQMLTVKNPAGEWIPVGCGEGDTQGLAARASRMPMNPAIVLETNGARLRAPTMTRLSDLRRLSEDPESRRYMFSNQKLSDNQLKALIHHHRLRQKRTGLSCWPAYRKSDRAFIGLFELQESELVAGVEINVAVVPNFRGDPLVKEVYQAVLGMGLSRLGLKRIVGLVAQDNLAAQKFAERMGFRYLHDVLVRNIVALRLYEIGKDDLRRARTSSSL